MSQYISWDQKVRDKTVGYFLCSRKGLHTNHLNKLSSDLLNDYAKIMFLQFKKIMNSLDEKTAYEILPGLNPKVDKKTFSTKDINFYVNEELLKFGLSSEKDRGFNIYKKYSIFEGISSLNTHAINWASLFIKFKDTAFFKSLTPSDWYGDLNYKEHFSIVWKKMFKQLEDVYPEHRIEQENFIKKCAKSSVLKKDLFKYSIHVNSVIYFLEYSGDKDLAKALANHINGKSNDVTQNVFRVMESLNVFVFNKHPELKSFFKDFEDKLNNLNKDEIFDTDEEMFQVALSFPIVQKRLLKSKRMINNPKELISMLNSYFGKANEGDDNEERWTSCIQKIIKLNDNDFDYSKIVFFCAVDRKMKMEAKDVKTILISELDSILSETNPFYLDIEKIENQSQKLRMLFENKKAETKKKNKLIKF